MLVKFMKQNIDNLIEDKMKQINRRLEYNDLYLAGKYTLELGFLYEYKEEWELSEKCYKDSSNLLNKGIKQQFSKPGIVNIRNVLNLMFPQSISYFKLRDDLKARETIKEILKYFNEVIKKFESGDRTIFIDRISTIAICYFFQENYNESYKYSKYLVDNAIENKRLKEYAYYNITFLLSKAKIENDIKLAKEARNNLFKYVRGDDKEKIKYQRPFIDLYSISALLANDVNSDIKEALRIGGWPLKDKNEG